MKFCRSLIPLMGLLLIGWALAFWGGSSTGAERQFDLKGSTIGKALERSINEPVADISHASVHQALPAPTVSHQIPPLLGVLIPLARVRFKESALILPKPIAYFFFAWFRRLFGNQIAINAP